MNNQVPRVEMHNGELVLIDPVAEGVIRAVNQENCRRMLEPHMDRIEHFINRVAVLGKSPSEVVLVLLAVDDSLGGWSGGRTDARNRLAGNAGPRASPLCPGPGRSPRDSEDL
jgi:hypothetical protein